MKQQQQNPNESFEVNNTHLIHANGQTYHQTNDRISKKKKKEKMSKWREWTQQQQHKKRKRSDKMKRHTTTKHYIQFCILFFFFFFYYFHSVFLFLCVLCIYVFDYLCILRHFFFAARFIWSLLLLLIVSLLFISYSESQINYLNKSKREGMSRERKRQQKSRSGMF